MRRAVLVVVLGLGLLMFGCAPEEVPRRPRPSPQPSRPQRLRRAQHGDPFGGGFNTLNRCDADGDRTYIVGAHGSPHSAAVWTTADGRNFERLDHGSFPEFTSVSDIEVFADGRIWIVGPIWAPEGDGASTIVELDDTGAITQLVEELGATDREAGTGMCDMFDPTTGARNEEHVATLTGIIEAYEAEARRVCELFPNCFTDGGLLAGLDENPDFYSEDLNHLNARGQAWIAEGIWPLVADSLGLSSDCPGGRQTPDRLNHSNRVQGCFVRWQTATHNGRSRAITPLSPTRAERHVLLGRSCWLCLSESRRSGFVTRVLGVSSCTDSTKPIGALMRS